MNKFILGVIFSVVIIGLGFLTFAIDGMRALSGHQPIFWWLYGSLNYIPLLLVLYLVYLGLKTLWNKE